MQVPWLRVIVSLCFWSSAHAAPACAPVDLRPLLGEPLHQGDSGYCFAHSAATLIRAKFGLSVSPMQLATHYILANPEEVAGAAAPEVKERITPALLRFWRDDRRAEPENYRKDRILTEQGLLDTGGDEVPTLLAANFLGLCPEERLPTGPNVYKEYLAMIRAFHAERVRRGLPPEEASRPIGEVTDPQARDMAWSYRHWVENRCGTPFFPPRPLLPTMVSVAKNLKQFRLMEAMNLLTAADARGVVMRVVDERLSRGEPVAIGYALGDLMPDSQIARSENKPVDDLEVDHASVIAGRKLVHGKCYYYLRNSFGRDTKGYRPRFKGRLNQGGVWVLPEELPSLYSATWLD